MIDAHLIAQSAVLQAFPPEGLRVLAGGGRRRRFQAGDAIIRQGQASDCVHVIVQGRVRVERSHPSLNEPFVLAEMGPGELLGEMGVLDGDPRSATVIAAEDTETVEIAAEAVAQALLAHPEGARPLLRLFSKRLRNTNELLEAMHRANAPGRKGLGGKTPIREPTKAPE